MVDTLTIIFYVFFIGFIIFQRLGGYPEAWYRIRRVPYFIDYIRGPDKKYRRHVDQMSAINTSSGLSLWPFGEGAYNLPESEASLNVNGAPMWFHAWNEMRAIPQYMDTIVGPDGKEHMEYRPKIPPSVIKAAFKSQVAKDIHREEQPKEGPSGFKWYTVTALGVGIIIMVALLYFEYNNYCGLHPAAC